jgi:hypothetical protein
MANANVKWTVLFPEKRITCQGVKNPAGWPVTYKIDNDSFWSDSKWQDIHVIQFIDDSNDHNDCVEMVPGTFGRNKTWAESNLGDFRSQFIDKWDVAHLAQLQADWDADGENLTDEAGNPISETEAEKISRIGARPTSYTSP